MKRRNEEMMIKEALTVIYEKNSTSPFPCLKYLKEPLEYSLKIFVPQITTNYYDLIYTV